MDANTAIEMLRPSHSEHLTRFRIPSDMLETAGVRSMTDAEARQTLGINGHRDADLAGILFPYRHPVTGERVGGRIRLDTALPDGGKYISELGCRRFFFAPGAADFLRDTGIPAVIVEAEKSSLAITALADRNGRKLLVIAIGGCWGWKRTVGKRLVADGSMEPETGPGPDLDLVAWQGRTAVLAFDSNASKNSKVQKARNALAEELQRRAAKVLIAEIPYVGGVNGPDDFIAVYGDGGMLAALDSVHQQGPRSAISVSAKEADWPDPAPLDEELRPVRPFVSELLPTNLRPMVEDISERMQTPPDFAASAAVTALAGCVNRRALIRPKAVDDSWEVIPNLWGAIVAPPGFMKSPVLHYVTRSLTNIQELWHADYEQKASEYDRITEEEELKLQSWRERYKQANKAGKSAPLRPDLSASPPTEKRLLLTDSTYEKLHEILSQNPAGVLVLRDELTGWLAGLDRQGREGERAFYLQAWNGDAGFAVDRIGRGSVYVPAVCVSLLGNIQPARLRYYLSEVLAGGPNDDGLFQRFQVLVWPDPSRDWKNVDRKPNSRALLMAEEIFRTLAALSAENPVAMNFDGEAQQLFFEWLEELERRVRCERGLSPAAVGHLSKYRKLMPSLAGLFELADRARGWAGWNERVTIGIDHARQAAAFCEYLESHALRVYGCVESPECHAARELARHIQAEDLPRVFKTRDVYLKGWRGLATPNCVREALELLEDSAWVRRGELALAPTAGRPPEFWFVNPKVRCEK